MHLIIAVTLTMMSAIATAPKYAQNYQATQMDRLQAAAAAAAPKISKIVSVRGILVDQSIATQLSSMVTAAQKDGVSLTGTGYRSLALQTELRRQNCGPSKADIYTKPEESCHPPTAIPGTSMHEKGLAVDFWYCASKTTPVYKWLASHAATYGFHNRADESWHWSTNGL